MYNMTYYLHILTNINYFTCSENACLLTFSAFSRVHSDQHKPVSKNIQIETRQPFKIPRKVHKRKKKTGLQILHSIISNFLL